MATYACAVPNMLVIISLLGTLSNAVVLRIAASTQVLEAVMILLSTVTLELIPDGSIFWPDDLGQKVDEHDAQETSRPNQFRAS